MKKNNYSAPKMVQVKVEAEMPVMAGSGSTSNFTTEPVEWL